MVTRDVPLVGDIITTSIIFERHIIIYIAEYTGEFNASWHFPPVIPNWFENTTIDEVHKNINYYNIMVSLLKEHAYST